MNPGPIGNAGGIVNKADSAQLNGVVTELGKNNNLQSNNIYVSPFKDMNEEK